MNKDIKTFLIIISVIFVAGASIAYGALTAPQKQSPAVVSSSPSTTPSTSPGTSPKPTSDQLEKMRDTELPTIKSVLTASYPLIATDYTINKGSLFDEGQWYGTTLTYHGKDTMNRDTLRVLMQKKDGIWILLTKPPVLLLSTEAFPNVPKKILQAINQPISLPAADETTSPAE